MRSILLILAAVAMVTATCVSCAKSNTVGIAPKVPIVVDFGVALFTPEGFGRGCPIDGTIFTARHVVKKDREPGFFNAMWSQGDRRGYASVELVSEYADGASMTVNSGIVMSATMGDPTEDLTYFEYSYNNVLDALRTVEKHSKMLRQVGGYIIFTNAPTHGASGGCLYNDEGHAVGIVVWRLEMENGKFVGVGLRF